ncbi:MAG: SDR family NAD(P)-dependent oxidoreductase [Lutibacter sp.]|nr:SDR family NAD(P)-dependent oxidoreductase [Lutibacter sp.]MDT8417062.1 SDR family NAD(P)-dependent oxidoreductase [Lutibacter sp.]
METKYYTLITGASKGFGKAMAIECAKRKMNTVLVSLPNTGLNELADILKRTYNVSVLPIEMDLSLTENCYSLFEQVEKEQIAIKYFINNAGLLSRGFFMDLDINYILTQIKLNVCTPTILIKLFLNNLKQNVPSAIMNVGSMASYFYLPKKQVYGGTKAYLLSFSKSLRRELKPDKISVSIVCPGGLNTTPSLTYQNRTGSWGSRMSIMNPEDAAKLAIDGMLKGKEVIVPGIVNKFYMLLNSILPKPVKDKITSAEMNKFKTEILCS